MLRAQKALADASHSVGGSEQWSDLQTLVLGKAWYNVSANPAGPGAGQVLDSFYELVLVAYHFFFKQLGGVESKAKRGRVFKAITAKGCKNKWQSINKETMRFLSCDILASHTAFSYI